jgi:glutamine amidotransferase
MKRVDVIVVDAGTGNLHSVDNALRSLGYAIHIAAEPVDVLPSLPVVLPGVGAFATFMQGLRSRGLDQCIRDVVRRGDPLLGICVGMQALFEISDEMGEHEGLGLLPGKVTHFPEFEDLKVPHTGWNQLWFEAAGELLDGLKAGDYTYFNHSYYCVPSDSSDILATTDYGLDFASCVRRENIYGVQFHPEKSQRVGQQILTNFLKEEI